MSIKIHIYLFLMAAYMFAIGKLEMFLYYYLFVILHEFSHIIMAILLNVDIAEITLLPIGVNATYKDSLEKNVYKEILISLAGPAASFLFALFLKDKTYVMMNIVIGIFNLIPIYPFDGGKIICGFLCIIFGDKRGKNISRYLTKVFLLLVLIIGMIIIMLFKNYYVLILMVYVIYIAKEEFKKDELLKFYSNLDTSLFTKY